MKTLEGEQYIRCYKGLQVYNQLVLKPCSKSTSTMAHSNWCTVAHRIHS